MVMLVSVLIALAPASTMLCGQAQIEAPPDQELVDLADIAEQQVKNLIDLVYANETVLQKIENFGLLDELENNVTLYKEGVANLTAAYKALDDADYEGAVDYATEALSVFREVFSSIHVVLEAADLQKGQLVDNQGLLEAITRQLQRIDRLREILPEDTPAEITQLLGDAEALLDIDAARASLIEGKSTEVNSSLQEAKQLIMQIYEYLKEKAEASNAWRIDGYCDRVLQRIMERFQQGHQMGIVFTDVIESLGYQSENQFMERLEEMIQAAQGKAGDFKNALQDLDAIGQMVQEMDQALTQEMYRHQGGNGQAGGDGGYGSGGMDSGYGRDSGGSNKP